MKQNVDNRVVLGVAAIVLIGLVFFGFRYISGPKQGEKPALDPVLNRMYGPHPAGSVPGQPQNQADTASQNK